jgi:hypothetical protein
VMCVHVENSSEHGKELQLAISTGAKQALPLLSVSSAQGPRSK